MFSKAHASLLATILVGCAPEGGSTDEVADEASGSDTSGDGETAEGTDGDASTEDSGDDTTTDTESSSDESTDESTDETEGGDCEDFDISTNPTIDWAQASGLVTHAAYGGAGTGHLVHAIFITEADDEDSNLCVEWMVGDGNVGVDTCSVFYTTDSAVGGQWPANGFENIAVDLATFDFGEGPFELFSAAGDAWTPSSQSGSFSPDIVPFGGIATLAVNFVDLPDLDLDLDVPQSLLPVGPDSAGMTLGSEALASWTWSNSGGSEQPIELGIDIGATPYGEGWPDFVHIRCNVTDDGEFAFPSEYFDLARERLGPEIHAGAWITRRNRGQVPLAGANLHWDSSHQVLVAVEVID
jgi:hypothetical protein